MEFLKKISKHTLLGAAFGLGIASMVGGTLAFQTFWPAPATTGSANSNNDSLGFPLAKMGRANCDRPGAISYRDKCLEKMDFTSANVTACETTLNGWMDFKFEDILRYDFGDKWIVFAQNTATQFMIAKKIGSTVAPYHASVGATYASTYYDVSGAALAYAYAGIPTYAYQAGVGPHYLSVPYAAYGTTVTYNSTYVFLCAYFRDMR